MSCLDQSCFKECMKWVINFGRGGGKLLTLILVLSWHQINMGMAVSTHHGSHQADFEIMRQDVWKRMFVNCCPGHWWVHKIGSACKCKNIPNVAWRPSKIPWSFLWGSFPCKVTLSGCDTRLDLRVVHQGARYILGDTQLLGPGNLAIDVWTNGDMETNLPFRFILPQCQQYLIILHLIESASAIYNEHWSSVAEINDGKISHYCYANRSLKYWQTTTCIFIANKNTEFHKLHYWQICILSNILKRAAHILLNIICIIRNISVHYCGRWL